MAGDYTVSVKLVNHVTLALDDVSGSPYDIVVLPGEVKSVLCFTTGVDSAWLSSFKAGTTKRFTTTLVDIYGNIFIEGSSAEVIEIKASYEEHETDWGSAIGVPDLHMWDRTYGKDLVGITSDN